MDFSQLSNEDLLALKSGNYAKLSDQGLMALKQDSSGGFTKGGAKQPIPSDVVNEQGVQADPMQIARAAGQMSAAGMAGIGNLTAGNGLQQAAGDVKNVMAGQSPETTSGKVGNVIGKMVSPANIALTGATGAALQPIAEAAGPMLSKAKDVAFAPFKSTAAAGMNEAEQGAGVVLRAPITKQIAADLGLPKGSQTFAHVTNELTDKLTAGEQVNPQTLKDFLLKGDTVLKNPQGSGERAAVSKAMALARSSLNSQIPERAAPAADFGNAAMRSKLLKMGGAIGAGTSATVYALKRLGMLGS